MSHVDKKALAGTDRIDTVDPTITDDDTKGFQVDSRWINEASEEEFVCLDAITNAAIWKSTTSGGTGEANTISNVGTAGVGVFKQKVGIDFQLKNLNAGSSKITVTDDVGNNEVDIDVDESNLDHGSLGGLGDDDHTQYQTDARAAVLHFLKSEFLNVSSGAPDADKPIKLNASGQLDDSMLTGKVDKVPSAGVENLAAFDATGAIVDSGFPVHRLNRIIPTAIDDIVEIGELQIGNGGHNFIITITVTDATFSHSKTYLITGQWSGVNIWDRAIPAYDTGVSVGGDFDLDLKQDAQSLFLRLRKTVGTVAGATAYISILDLGKPSNWTAMSGTASVTAPTTLYNGTVIKEQDDKVYVYGPINMDASGTRQLIKEIADPASDFHATHKKYVDDEIAGHTHDTGDITDISDPGSGAIITDAERTKLTRLPDAFPIFFIATGALVVIQKIDGARAAPVDIEIVKVFISRRKAGTGGSTIADINVSSSGGPPTSLYTTQANRPTVTAAAGDGLAIQALLPDTVLISAGQFITIDIDQVETGTGINAPEDLDIAVGVLKG